MFAYKQRNYYCTTMRHVRLYITLPWMLRDVTVKLVSLHCSQKNPTRLTSSVYSEGIALPLHALSPVGLQLHGPKTKQHERWHVVVVSLCFHSGRVALMYQYRSSIIFSGNWRYLGHVTMRGVTRSRKMKTWQYFSSKWILSCEAIIKGPTKKKKKRRSVFYRSWAHHVFFL